MADSGRWRLSALLALLIFWVHSTVAGDDTAGYSIFLVRHAEKMIDVPDPGLTPEGEERAERLADWVSRQDISAVWSSDYRRSRDTAMPSAEALGSTLEIYDPRQLEKTASILLSRAESALVVGHSNTTPQLASLLCRCTVEAMKESEYGRVIVVTVHGERRSVDEFDQASLRPAPGSD